MRDLNEILTKINEANDKYEVCKLGDTHTQSEILQTLSTYYLHLTEYRVKFNDDWMSVYLNSKANSSAAKEREADTRVPELYKIRHFMSNTKLVIDSLRTSISANKQN